MGFCCLISVILLHAWSILMLGAFTDRYLRVSILRERCDIFANRRPCLHCSSRCCAICGTIRQNGHGAIPSGKAAEKPYYKRSRSIGSLRGANQHIKKAERDVKENNRPKFGDPGYSTEDAKADTAALERAVMKGPEAVHRFYVRRGGAPFTGRALGIACRYMGLDTVKALLEHGATFGDSDKKWDWQHKQYELMIVPSARPLVKRAEQKDIPLRERLEMIDLLYRHAKGDFSEALYLAITGRDFDVAEKLLDLGAELTPSRVAFLTGASGGAAFPEHKKLRDVMRKISDADLKRMISLLRRCPGVDKIAVYEGDLLDNVPYYGRVPQDRFLQPDMMGFMLENTTMRKVIPRRILVGSLVERNYIESLDWLLKNGFLNRQNEINMLMEMLDEASQDRSEMRAMAVAHRAAHPPKDRLSIPTDPFAASVMRRLWKYETCGENGTEVRILRYKGDGTNVSVPARIGRRPVTEIGPKVFQPSETLNEFGSVSFPGSIKCLTSCLGPHNRNADTQEVKLEEGISEIGEYALHATSIRELHLPQSVRLIGENAFSECLHLSWVVLPDKLDALPADAFRGCRSLVSLPISPGLRTVGERAYSATGIQSADVSHIAEFGQGTFSNCEALTHVKLPDTLLKIPPRIFARCTSLLEMPDAPSAVVIGSMAFEHSGLRNVKLGSMVEKVKEGAFQECRDLSALEMDDRLQEIGRKAFLGCGQLSSVEWPDTLTHIGESAFQRTGLEHVTIPGRMTVDALAFADCSSLQDTYIAASAVLGEGVFSGCHELQRLDMEPGGDEIPALSFANCPKLKEVNLPDTVIRIGDSAFLHTGIKEIDLPASIREIGNDAFSDSKLNSINITSGIKVGERAFLYSRVTEARISGGAKLGKAAFEKCPLLTSVVLEEGVGTIPERAFADCVNLRSLRIPDTVKTIGRSAFENSGLENIEIPPSVTMIEEGAFAGTSLERIVVPDTVKFIGAGAFSRCRRLRDVILPDGTEVLPPALFEKCTSLTEINLPDSLREMGFGIFAGSGLRKILIPDRVPVIPWMAFDECAKLSEITLPDGLETIGDRAFHKCKDLKAIHLPRTLTYIGERAFSYSGLAHLIIPAGVHMVGDEAFKGCKALEDVRLESKRATIGRRAFSMTSFNHLNPPTSKIRKKKRWLY